MSMSCIAVNFSVNARYRNEMLTCEGNIENIFSVFIKQTSTKSKCTFVRRLLCIITCQDKHQKQYFLFAVEI